LQTKEKADNGDAALCYKVALAYMNGNDVVNKNPANAFHYMKSAADRGYTAAYIEVAKMYHGGRGVAKNRSTAEFWYKKAADAGNAEARRILLNM
jgi:TPR repeat protein